MLALLEQIPLFSKKVAVMRPRTQFFRAFNQQTILACDNGQHTRLWLSAEFGRVYITLGKETPGVAAGADRVIIQNFVAETPHQGDGNQAMAMLCALADETRVQLLISAKPTTHRSLGYHQITTWLNKHGYEKMGIPDGLFWRDPGAGPIIPEPTL